LTSVIGAKNGGELQKLKVGRGKINFDQLNPEERINLETKFKDEINMLAKFEEEKQLETVESLYFSGNVNYKETFYRSKFDCDALDVQDLRNQVRDYFVEGLMWNMTYYYQGCASWEWFYPYYYAPFPSDFVSIKHLQGKQFNLVGNYNSRVSLLSLCSS
jgi:5'-3' exonuclease